MFKDDVYPRFNCLLGYKLRKSEVFRDTVVPANRRAQTSLFLRLFSISKALLVNAGFLVGSSCVVPKVWPSGIDSSFKHAAGLGQAVLVLPLQRCSPSSYIPIA
ncbi:hypothetical protein M514_15790 [Trichuris suis]|uniref:Uncharacterized protein n=1 Tax=Trichuris suis TaxID=68888 RepID=A0A085NRJ2_9BILA|nr:hypothetical protein M514_15790 [Trichuris suis]